jgi:hypothetical protein
MLVRLGFLVSLLATFPLQMSPFRDSLWKLLFRQQLQVGGHDAHDMHAGRLLDRASRACCPRCMPVVCMPACPLLACEQAGPEQAV